MEYKSYISALFYLTEAQSYVAPELTELNNSLESNVLALLEDGYNSTNYLCFKFSLELKKEFPELEFGYRQPKSSLGKTSTFLRLRKNIPAQNYPNQQQYEAHILYDENFQYFRGTVAMLVKVYLGDLESEEQELTLELRFDKCKQFNQEELDRLVREIRRFNF